MCDKKEKQLELDKRYLRMAAVWAENSYCKRRQVGALIVRDQMIISDGYNGTPSGQKSRPCQLLPRLDRRSLLPARFGNSRHQTRGAGVPPFHGCAAPGRSDLI